VNEQKDIEELIKMAREMDAIVVKAELKGWTFHPYKPCMFRPLEPEEALHNLEAIATIIILVEEKPPKRRLLFPRG